MSAAYTPLFASVLIETGVNDEIEYTDGSGAGTATVAPGTYYLRGDGDDDDLAQAIVDAFTDEGESSPVCTVTFDTDAANRGATVVTGFSGLVSLDGGTFDLALLGLEDGAAAAAGVATSTLTPSCVWVPTQPLARLRPRYPSRSVQTMSRSRKVRTLRLAAQGIERTYAIRNVDGRRVNADENRDDEAAAFSSFLDLVRDGRGVELRSYELAAGAITLDTSTVEWLGVFHLAPPILDDWEPMRTTGPSRWGWDIPLRQNPTETGPAAPTVSYANLDADNSVERTLTPTLTGVVTSLALTTGALEAGWSINTTTGVITIPIDSPAAEVTGLQVTATGPGGVGVSAAFSITITEASSAFAGGAVSAASLYDAAVLMATADDTASPGDTAGGTLTIDSVALGSYDFHKVSGAQTVSAFAAADWFTATEDSRWAFVLVDGDLTIDAGQVFKPAARKLGLVLYVTGALVVNGEVSMSARGANHSAATGSNVAAGAILIASGTYSGVVDPEIPAAGGAGAAGVGGTGSGVTGTAGTSGAAGGGGSGAVVTGGAGTSGAGAAGTSFSGGAGGGALHAPSGSGGAGAADGGAGGDGFATSGSNRGAPGGAGNPGGDPLFFGSSTADAGGDGAGGSLVVMCEGTLSGSGSFTSHGVAGGNGTDNGGGGSGGGSVTVLVGSGSGPSVTANGGAAGTATRNGGAGGAGDARLLTGLA